MQRRDVSEGIHPFFVQPEIPLEQAENPASRILFSRSERGKRMLKLKKAAVAGTLESSDVMISVEPGASGGNRN